MSGTTFIRSRGNKRNTIRVSDETTLTENCSSASPPSDGRRNSRSWIGRHWPILIILAASTAAVALVVLSLRREDVPSSNVMAISDGSLQRSILSDTTVAQTTPIRFYVYEEEDMTQEATVGAMLREWLMSYDTCPHAHTCDDALSEWSVLNALRGHPWRTRDASQADLFIVPILIAGAFGMADAVMLSKKEQGQQQQQQLVEKNVMDIPFQALVSHELFRKHQGHRHVLVSFQWMPFSTTFQSMCRTKNPQCRALQQYYPALENVTLAQHFDAASCARILEQASQKRTTELRGYDNLFRTCRPVTTSQFSAGLGITTTKLPLILQDSFQTFQQRPLNIFYRTRVRGSFSNSTWFRHAPLHHLEPDVQRRLSPSSIGHDLPYRQWLADLQSSKFCLVIRGDTPHSHALLYALRSGCIPVVISDFLEEYAGPLRSTLTRLEDYAVVLREDEFRRDPGEALLGLLEEEWSEEQDAMRQKLQGVAWAQQVLFPDHPQSVFVPSFLKEALNAWEHRRRSRNGDNAGSNEP